MDKQQKDFLKRVRAHLARPGCQTVVVHAWPEAGEYYIQVDVCGLAYRLEAVGLLETGKMVVLRVLPVSKKRIEVVYDKPA